MARYDYRYRKPQRKRIRLSRLVTLLLLIGLIVYPFAEPWMLKVEEKSVQISGLPTALKNLRIVYLSDIHMGQQYPPARVATLIKQINALSPDLVLLGGDYAEDSDGAIDFFQTAPAIQARLGVYAVVGNHDRTEPESNLSLLVAEIKRYGAIPLCNYVDRVKVGKSYIYLAGVDDYYNGYPDVNGVASQVREDDFVIFLGHTPDLLASAFSAKSADGNTHWFDLALFGHTHGGQVTLLGKPLFRNLEPEIGDRYLTGWREENRAHILVSNGVGTSVFPVRLFAPPQIHVITLKAK